MSRNKRVEQLVKLYVIFIKHGKRREFLKRIGYPSNRMRILRQVQERGLLDEAESAAIDIATDVLRVDKDN